jgi:thymidylate synthase (FAD)
MVKQSKSNKQGSDEELIYAPIPNQQYLHETCVQSMETYERLLQTDLTRELARGVLPVNTYTKWFFKMDLRNLFNLLNLRLDQHAQWEIRQYAQAMEALIKPLFPISYEAFEDYIRFSHRFSKQEMELIEYLFHQVPDALKENMISDVKAKVNEKYKSKISKREMNVFLEKLGMKE